MKFRRVAIVPMMAGLLLLTGCPGPKREAVFPVTGKVTVEGKPLAGCNIVFSPVGTGVAATGVIGTDGSYKLSTDVGREGAAAGKYKVYFTVSQEMSQKMMTEQMAAQMKGGAPGGMGKAGPPKFKKPFPESYGEAATTPKEVTVEAKTNAGVDITI